jgi:hypothetical protein
MPLADSSLTKMKQFRMHRVLVTIICAHIGLSARAQTDSIQLVKWRSSFEIPRSEEIEFFKATSTASPVIFSKFNDAILIRPMDVSTGLPIRLLSIRSNETKEIQQHHLVGDSIYCLVKSVKEDKSETFESVIYTLTGDQLAEAHRHEILFEKLEDRKNTSPIFFAQSKNGKYGLVSREQPFSRENRASVFVEISKFPGQIIQTFTLSLPFDADDVEILDVTINDRGKVYFGAKTGVKLNSPFLRKYLVYSFDSSTKKLREFDLGRDKIYLQDLLINTFKDDVQMAALFTSDPFQQHESSGYAFASIDSLGKLSAEKGVNYFDPATVAAFKSEDNATSNTIENVFLDELFNVNGSNLLVMDQHYRDQVCTTDPRTGMISCTDQFHFDGIAVENLTNPGASVNIGRSQIDYNKVGMHVGHQTISVDLGLLIIYNDHYKNESIKAERIMNNPARSSVRYVIINEKGLSSTGFLNNQKQNEFVLVSTVPGYLDGSIWNGLFSNGKEFRIGTVEINDL